MTSRELRAIRKRLGWTQKRLAEAVGITPNGLAMAERGETGISEPLSRLIRLIASGVDVDAIVNPASSRHASPSQPPKRTHAGHSKGEDRKGPGKSPVSRRGR